jgi:hypothetical protein
MGTNNNHRPSSSVPLPYPLEIIEMYVLKLCYIPHKISYIYHSGQK